MTFKEIDIIYYETPWYRGYNLNWIYIRRKLIPYAKYLKFNPERFKNHFKFKINIHSRLWDKYCLWFNKVINKRE
jgi:hypothetical protein